MQIDVVSAMSFWRPRLDLAVYEHNAWSCVMPRWLHWKYGPHWHGYYSENEVSRATVETSATELLKRATKGAAWRTPRGFERIPLLVDNEIVGHLWEDAALSELEIGAYWAGPFGQKVELLKGDRVIGMMWTRAA